MKRNPLWDARAKAFLESGGAGQLMSPDVPTSLAEAMQPQIYQPPQPAQPVSAQPPVQQPVQPQAVPPVQSQPGQGGNPQPLPPPPVWDGQIPKPPQWRQKPQTEREPYSGFERGQWARRGQPQGQPTPLGDEMSPPQPQLKQPRQPSQQTVNGRTPFRYKKMGGTDY